MERSENKKLYKSHKRKVKFGIKLPAMELGNFKFKTITDVDPDFYSAVENRPIRPNISHITYKQNIRNIAIMKATKGFLQDEILRINKGIERESSIYQQTCKDFEDYKKSFDKFLAHDNDMTIEVMQKSDALAKQVSNQAHEHKQASFELATVKSKLQYMNESIMILISLENFLHKASPVLWRESKIIKTDNIVPNDIFEVNSNIFQPTDINAIKDKISKLPQAKLYFERPEQLIEVFDALEKQNLNFLLATEETRSQKIKAFKAFEDYKNDLQKEISHMDSLIKDIEQIIAVKESRQAELNTIFFSLLEEKLRELVISKPNLKMYNALEFAYAHVIAPNDIKLSVFEMCKALESEFNNLMFELSVFDPKVIKKIEKDIYQTADRKLKQAIRADKLLKDVDKLYKRLNSCFDFSMRPQRN